MIDPGDLDSMATRLSRFEPHQILGGLHRGRHQRPCRRVCPQDRSAPGRDGDQVAGVDLELDDLHSLPAPNEVAAVHVQICEVRGIGVLEGGARLRGRHGGARETNPEVAARRNGLLERVALVAVGQRLLGERGPRRPVVML
jgi:hypothetical protein